MSIVQTALRRPYTIAALVKAPQSAIPGIRNGMEAKVSARECPGHAFAGKVARTSESVDPASRTLNVEVLVPNKDLALLPGMYVQVEFHLTREHSPLVILASALSLKSEGPEVAVVRKDGHVHFRKVSIARDLGDSVEISDGLRESDWVTLNISDEIREGDPVRAVPLQDQKVAVEAIPPTPPETTHGQHIAAASLDLHTATP